MMPSVGSITSPAPLTIRLVLLVDDREHRLEPAQDAVGPPVLGQLDDGAAGVVGVLAELLLEPLEQRERVGGAAGEAG